MILQVQVTCMLDKIIKDLPNINKFVLWFDSCVPQNRNSHMSAAIREFLIDHPSIGIIEQKFCQPGHSSIQECDNIHSQMDRALHSAEIFSPLGLVRVMLIGNRKKPFCVYQMKQNEVKGFSQIASLLNFKVCPISV